MLCFVYGFVDSMAGLDDDVALAKSTDSEILTVFASGLVLNFVVGTS